MLEFQLFRIKVLSKQMVFNGTKKPSEILLETINSLPSAETRRDMIWHVGNVSKIDETGLYFRVGRTTKAKREIYQEGKGFIDEEFEEAPYTHVVVDIPIEVCAIAKKAKLSPTRKGIANQLARLLSNSTTGQYYEAEFEIDLLKDPEDFVTHLRKAYAISRFWMTFTRPNPFDVKHDFTEPVSRLLKEVQAQKGKAQVEGKNLKPQILEELTHSAAAAGNEAVARLQRDEKEKPTIMRLSDNPVSLEHEDVSTDEQKKSLLNKVREVYRKVRGKLGNE
jgi:acyl-CoA synthetase (AMP-forming)/AMP-acid ligase II